MLVFAGIVVPGAGVAKAPAKPSPCGPPLSGSFSEPPNVDVWTLPKDAGGQHELILAVHRDGDRFCYRYRLNGTAETVAPAIRVHRGERFDLRIVNDISGQSRGEFVSSTVIAACMPMPMPMAPAVHYTGYLNHVLDDRWMPKPAVDTNIHFHGFQGPALEENIFLSTLSTPMHACEYHLTVPKTQPPGTYFYHPHVHGGSELQIAGGLAGAWIVEPDTAQIAPSADHLIVLSYRLPFKNDNLFQPDTSAFFAAGMLHEAALKNASPAPYDPFHPPAWPLGFPIQAAGLALDPRACDGLQSESLVTVNGHDVPASIDVPGGQEQLLRVVNGTSDSPKVLKLRDADGKTVPLHVVEIDGTPIGGDMTHPLARFLAVDRLMVASASRADILVNVPAGQTYTLSTTHFCEGSLAFFQMPQQLLRITGTSESAAADPPPVPSEPVNVSQTPASKLIAYARAHPALVRRRAITFTEYVFPPKGKIPPHAAYYITDTTNRDFRERPYYPAYAAGAVVPESADIVVKRGAIEEWYLVNTTMESHTFHIHQMSFVEMKGPGGVPATVDDMFVPVGALLPNSSDAHYPLVKPSVTKVLLDFRNVPRGTFVYHCHMLFHEDRGMMGVIRVV